MKTFIDIIFIIQDYNCCILYLSLNGRNKIEQQAMMHLIHYLFVYFSIKLDSKAAEPWNSTQLNCRMLTFLYKLIN